MSVFLGIVPSKIMYEDFSPVANKLYKKMINQGGSTLMILKQIKKGMDRHPLAYDFSKPSSAMIRDIQYFSE